MIYLIGGAPRSGKSTLCQRFAGELGIGWISTDLVVEVIDQAGVRKPQQWDARPEVVRDCADRFFPYLERIVSGINSTAEAYVVEAWIQSLAAAPGFPYIDVAKDAIAVRAMSRRLLK